MLLVTKARKKLLYIFTSVRKGTRQHGTLYTRYGTRVRKSIP